MLEKVKDYKIIKEIGRGGMAVIYLCEDTRTGLQSAIKVLLPHISSNRSFIEKFLMEVKANALLRHPNIVEIRDGGEADGQFFMVLEYIDGLTLQDLLKKVKKLPLDVSFLILLSIIKGLQYAHKKSIIHRDIKPSNIMITSKGEVKIADFGISKVADPSMIKSSASVMGTPAYMSPEQAMGAVLDARSDIFSTGIMFYEMLRGKNPFQTGQHNTTMKNVIKLKQPFLFSTIPTIPPEIDYIAEKMLQKDPAKRYQNTEHFLSELQSVSNKLELEYSEKIFREYLNDPEQVNRRLDKSRANRSFLLARSFYEKGEEHLDAAFWHCYVSIQLDSTNPEPRKLLDALLKTGKYNLEQNTSVHFREKERIYKKDTSNQKVLSQLLKIARVEGYSLQLVYYFNILRGFEQLDDDTLFAIHKYVRKPLIEIFDVEKKILSYDISERTKAKTVEEVKEESSFDIPLRKLFPSWLLWILLWVFFCLALIIIAFSMIR